MSADWLRALLRSTVSCTVVRLTAAARIENLFLAEKSATREN